MAKENTDIKHEEKKSQKKDGLVETLQELENNWKRALADYKNLEKRAAEEKAATMEFSNRVLIENLLPVLDNFEMLEEHTEDMGIKISIKEFRNVLKNFGLEEIEVTPNEPFDPDIMDALSSDKDGTKVISVQRKGYKFKGKLIRPTSVVVGGN